MFLEFYEQHIKALKKGLVFFNASLAKRKILLTYILHQMRSTL